MEHSISSILLFFFFFNDTATTEIYTLSLHDALPISAAGGQEGVAVAVVAAGELHDLVAAGDAAGQAHGRHGRLRAAAGDRKSTRLNSSHANISYAVFCLKKKKRHTRPLLHQPHM